MKSVWFKAVLLSAMASIVTSPLLLAAPPLINAQGRLTTAAGDTVAAGDYILTFTIYDADSVGAVIWTETNASVRVLAGQFNALLGSIVPLADSVFAGDNRWLAIKVGNDPEMTPRSRLVSVAYAQRTRSIDGAKGGRVDGEVLVDGNVGIGTVTPYSGTNVTSLTIDAPQYPVMALRADGANKGTLAATPAAVLLTTFGTTPIIFELDETEKVRIGSDGNVGIGTSAPAYPLDVSGNIRATGGVIAGTIWTGDGTSGSIRKLTPGIPLCFRNSGGTEEMVIDGSGNVGIGTTNPTDKLEIVGTTKTSVLEITGGSDLAEPFETSCGTEPAPGTVVIIDDQNPGKLCVTSEPYDSRVAGVISGAGGINPGLTLKQENALESGQNVALSGRVFVRASTVNGAIKPGDLLTTSSIPGLAMKATDRDRAFGSTIGKAMGVLDKGEGLVLVLVNLH